PKNSPLRSRVEPLRIEQCSLIVVAKQAKVALHDQVDTFHGVGSVADNVSQAVDFRDPLLLDVGQHGLEGFQVAVNVADQSPLHASESAVNEKDWPRDN